MPSSEEVRSQAEPVRKRLLRRIREAENGFAVALVMFVMIIMALLGLSLLTVAAYSWQDADRTRPSNRAFDLADAGLSYAHAYLARDGDVPSGTPPTGGYSSGTITMGAANSTFSVTIEKLNTAAYRYKITSAGNFQASERGATRNYTRTLEEIAEYRGTLGHFDAFNYVMYSADGDISLDTGWLAVNSTRLAITGNLHAANKPEHPTRGNITLSDMKAAIAVGYLQVNGNVEAERDATLRSRTGIIASSTNTVTGNLTAGGNVSISAETAVAAGSYFTVSGSVNAGGNVTMAASVGGAAGASVKVAQNSGTALNAKGSVSGTASAWIAAAPSVWVGNGTQASSLNCDGNVTLVSDDGAAAGSNTRVYGSVNARGNTNLRSTGDFLADPETRVYGSVRNNGSSTLYSHAGLSSSNVIINGDWQHGGGCVWDENWLGYIGVSGTHSDVNPNIGATSVASVPDVSMPQPDWSWYRTMAVAQGHYYPGDGDPSNGSPVTVSNFTIDGDPSSMWVAYVADDLVLQSVIYNVQKKGVIVCEGDVAIQHSVQFQANSEYQVIARGDVTHSSWATFNPFANDTVFIYTNGTHDHNSDGLSGSVTYDLGWMRDLQGQITANGNISAPVSGIARDASITYKTPSVPVEAWPIPFKIHSFREI